MSRRSATVSLVTLEVVLNLLINILLTGIILPSSIKDNILLLLILMGTCIVAAICVQLLRKQLQATIGVVTLAVILNVFINLLQNAIALPSLLKASLLLLLFLLGICVVASIYVQFLRKQSEVSGQIEPQALGPYLSAVILGVSLSLVNVLSMDLIPIVVGLDPSPTPLQVLPCLILSLIAGVTLARRSALLPASLLAGFIIGLSGDILVIIKYGPFLPYFPSYAWALITTDPVTCLLLAWLAAWIWTRTHGLLPVPTNFEQNKRRRSPAVTIFQILLALVVLGGFSFDIYHNVTSAHSGTIGNLSDIVWSGSQFVAVGGIGVDRAKGTILTSTDGRTWTPQTSNTSDFSMIWSIVWSNSQFVAVGALGTILTSTDGHTWMPQSSGTSSLLNGVVWSGSQFVAVGWGTTILTSPDGRTWTPQTSDTSPYRFYEGVACSETQCVVVGDYGILTTTDGRTWTHQPSGTSQWLNGVVWSGSQFVVVGYGGTILTSPDGHTWATKDAGTTAELQRVVWSGSQFVAVGDGGIILTSPDGHIWTQQPSGTSQRLTGVAWSGSQFVAVGYGGVILTSPDGRTWM